MWYVVRYNPAMKQFWVYRVTGNGNMYTLFKTFKTETAIKNFAKKNDVREW